MSESEGLKKEITKKGEEEYMEEDNESSDDNDQEDENSTAEQGDTAPRAHLPDQPLEDGEELVMDEQAYLVYHQVNKWPQ